MIRLQPAKNTLASAKAVGLFSYPYRSQKEVYADILAAQKNARRMNTRTKPTASFSMETADDTIARLTECLIPKGGCGALLCGYCWSEGLRHYKQGRHWWDIATRTELAGRFYSMAWRFRQRSVCPTCAEKLSIP
jgi:hypothetical protein